LIGSPRGYIGSEEGEIFIRVKGSDTGLILIDEFEKWLEKLSPPCEGL
jgi:ATP-dependent Clp protease ATP-binding subunit ClpC